ncbi:MAG TPA: uroporphyrinogen-III C-methyltransferase [Phycisphaerae bacterium]|nr:uroporphyrinogen-III C-methyltransferase [Phycisphaerales bacterium]HRX84026.1 uroporphyrinogen-III C-methyltransferase [Phycisphaerae bacterium]
MTSSRGIVYLVGAGPGAPDLITLRGSAALRRADVVVYDRLVDARLLDLAPAQAERIDAGKAPGAHTLTQDDINACLVARAQSGKTVVRLKGGDPFVFGRGSEELAACRAAGVACIVVPGVTSAVAGPGAAGIPVTNRGVARSVGIITAEGGADQEAVAHDYAALARLDTLVVLMGRSALAAWTRRLIEAGKDRNTPVACIASATTSRQRAVVGSLGDIAAVAEKADITAPMVTVVGEVARGADLETVHHLLPLAGRRVVLTAATDTSRRFADVLIERGALVTTCPLIRIVYPPASPQLRAAVQRLTRYAWVVFTSRHGVQAFFSALRAAHLDARALARCRVAAVGDATAHALRHWGVWPELVPAVHTAEGLADALSGWVNQERVLYPRSSLARDTLVRLLRDAGAEVDDIVAYRTEATAIDSRMGAILAEPRATVLLASPSAARVLARSHQSTDATTIAAIGPVTADAARQAGLRVDVVAPSPLPRHVADALEDYWARAEVTL